LHANYRQKGWKGPSLRVMIGAKCGTRTGLEVVMTRLEQTWQDVRYALRSLARSPAFTATVVLSLALGIGANTALFTLINAVAWRMLPVADPEHLYLLQQRERTNASAFSGFTYQQYTAIADHNRAVDLAAYSPVRLNVTIDGHAEPTAEGQLVSGNYFSLLG